MKRLMINYKIIGAGENLVLLHGFGFCADIFNHLIDRYKDRYRIFAIDLPGHGRSENIEGLDNWAEEIRKIIPQNSIILGWSLGGLVAIKLAQKIITKKIILCASTPKFIINNNWNYGIQENNFKSFSKNISINPAIGLIRFISLQKINKIQAKQLKIIIKNNPPAIIGLNNALNILMKTDLRNEIKTIKNIKVYLGNKDTIVPVELANWYAVNNISTNILNSGHIPFLHPDFLL